MRAWPAIALLGLGGLTALLAPGVLAQPVSETSALQGAPAVEDRPVRVQVGPAASVLKLERVQGDIVELVVRDTPAELDAVLNLRNTPAIRAMDAMGAGSQVWFVRVGLQDPTTDLDVRIEDGELVLEVVTGKTKLRSLRVSPPSIEQLVSGELPAMPHPPEPLELTALPGDAISLAMDAWTYQPALLPGPGWLPRSDWDAIDRARNAMLTADSESAETQARYRLGLHYLELGFGKEARYYFSEISKRPGPIAQRDLAIAASRAAIACGDWDEARKQLVEAWRLGAPEVGILEGLAVVSLATGSPSRAATGRALASATSRPESRMLAAELLQREGFLAETRPILEGLPDQLSKEDATRAWLRLGDARLMDGDVLGAAQAWEQTSPDLAQVRAKLVELLQGDPATWTAAIPGLVQASSPRTDAGAEALYLLAQIDLAVPIATREDAINELATLMRRYPAKSEGSDVPERFWKVYASYVAELSRAERWFDIAALHEAVWDRTVRRAITDPHVLVDVARAYEAVGLPERAMAVLRETVSILVARGQDEPALVYELARLYAELGRWQDGLRSIDYLRKRGIPEEKTGEIALLEARLHQGANDPESAALALRRAAQLPEHRDRASLELALMDAEAGRCDRAAPSLERLLFGPRGEETWLEPRPWVALSRCLRARGDAEGSARAARVAAERSAADTESRYATWLEAVATSWEDGETVKKLAEGDDIWAVMAREQASSKEFEAELDLRRETEWQRRR